MSDKRSFIFSGHDGMYVAYPLSDDVARQSRAQRRVEFVFSQIFGTSSVLSTSVAVWYMLNGNAALCVAGAVLSSFCTSLFWKRLSHAIR